MVGVWDRCRRRRSCRARGAAREVRAGRRCRPAIADVFGRHAPALGHRGVVGDEAARPVLGRADHRLGPHPPLRRRVPTGRGASQASSTSSRVTARRAPIWSTTRGSTRSRSPARPRSARPSSGSSPGATSRARSSSAARPRTSCSTTARSTRRSRGSSTGSTSTKGTCAAQGRASWCGQELMIHDQLVRKLKRRMATLRVGNPLDKNTDVGAINSSAQLERIAELVQSGIEEGAELYQPPCRLPERGWWFGPKRVHERRAEPPHRAEEIFGPVFSVLTFRRPRKRSRKRTTRATGFPPACGRRRGRGFCRWPTAEARASSGGIRSTDSIRRRRSAATRNPGSGAKAAGRGSSRT